MSFVNSALRIFSVKMGALTVPAYCNRSPIRSLNNPPVILRHQFTNIIILVTLSSVTLMLLAVGIINIFSNTIVHFGIGYGLTTSFVVGLIVLFVISWLGHTHLAANLFIALLTAAFLQLLIRWGFMLPAALLLLVMIIIIAGSLLGSRYSLIYAGLATIILVTVSYLQQNDILSPDTRWLDEPFDAGDAMGYAVILVIIGIVSWLSNCNIDRSLQRALASEKALAVERDGLELKVLQRTRQLEDNQRARVMELRRFAEFGRLSANLLHEIANPLTAAFLNLELVKPEVSSQVVQAQKNLKQLERYVDAARQQLRGSGQLQNFAVRKEITQLLRMIAPRVAGAQLQIVYTQAENHYLFGDPVKFSQVIGNILLNAIEARTVNVVETKKPKILLNIKSQSNFLVCSVQDFGIGLSIEQLSHIFKPFYSTKQSNERSLGIGLAIVEQFVKQDFKGRISVKSKPGKGTIFTIRFRLQLK